MVGSRTLTALVGLAVSLLLTAVAWRYFGVTVLFVFLPFIPLLFRGRGGGDGATETETEAGTGTKTETGADADRPGVRRCPICGYRTDDPAYTYCPRDGAQLRTP